MYTSRPTGGRKNPKSIMPSLNEKDYKTKPETDLVSVSPKLWFKFVFLLLKKKKRNLKFNMKHGCAKIL